MRNVDLQHQAHSLGFRGDHPDDCAVAIGCCITGVDGCVWRVVLSSAGNGVSLQLAALSVPMPSAKPMER
jgi:hypothetical protein